MKRLILAAVVALAFATPALANHCPVYMKQIDEALRRLETGSYGHCVECSQGIAAARLKALPFARLCRDCQERHEQRSAAEREQRGSDGQFARVVS